MAEHTGLQVINGEEAGRLVYRLYPALAGYMTRYILRERARSSEVEALPRLYESASPFPRDITGHTSRQHVI